MRIQLVVISVCLLLANAVAAQDESARNLEVISADNLDKLGPLKSLEFSSPVFSVKFDGEKTLAISSGTALYLYDTNDFETSPQILQSDNVIEAITSIDFSPDGKLLAASDVQGTVFVWDLMRRRIAKMLKEPESYALCLVFSPDGTKLVSADGAYVYMWNVETFELISTFQPMANSYCVAFSPDSSLLAVSGFSNGLSVIELDTGKTVRSNSDIDASEISFSVYGNGVIFSDVSMGIGVFDLEYNAEAYLSQKRPIAYRPIDAMALSPDGSLILSGDRSGQVLLWRLWPPEEFVVTYAEDTHINDVAFHPDGTTIAIAYSDDRVEVWGVLRDK